MIVELKAAFTFRVVPSAGTTATTMTIKELHPLPMQGDDSRLLNSHTSFAQLLRELREMDLPAELTASINREIDRANDRSGTARQIRKRIGHAQHNVLQLVREERNLVPRHYYRNLGIAIGMAALGIPFGVVFGLMLDNMAFIGIGMPIGLSIGIAIGTDLDRKAYAEGRQLQIEVEV